MEQELAQANANLSGEAQPTKRVVNWGGVLKGVAIVGAVALVAVVALPAFATIGGTISEFIVETPALKGIAVGLESAAAWVTDTAAASVAPGGFISNALGYVGETLNSLVGSALDGVGLTGKSWAGADATAKAIAAAGTVGTVAVAAHGAMPAIQNLQLDARVPADLPPANPAADQGLLAAQGATAHAGHHSMLHDAAHAAHHAAEDTSTHADVDADSNSETPEAPGRRNWASKFMQKAGAHASHSDAVRANKAPRTLPQPAASFGEQIAEDRMKLEGALAK
jgi:hypothetical protein